MDEMNGMKCPACGEMLKLEMAQPEASAEPSMEEANTLPLDTLRKRLPKKSEE